MKRTLGVALLLMAALVVFAPSSDAGAYLGAGVTQTTLKLGDFPFDEHDSGAKLFAGWSFFRFFALEAGYYDLGNPGNSQFDLEPRAVSLAARGILPLGKHWELSAKAGYMGWDLGSSPTDDNGVDPTYGVGAAVVFAKHVSIRAEYECLNLDFGDMKIYSLGAAFRF